MSYLNAICMEITESFNEFGAVIAIDSMPLEICKEAVYSMPSNECYASLKICYVWV